MIRAINDLPDGILGFETSGKLTTQDYTDVLVPALDAATGSGRKIRIVLVFADAFDGIEAGAVWQDLKTGMREWTAWESIALVTDHSWMRDAVHLFAWAIPGQVKVFPVSEREDAIAWGAHA